MASAAGVTVRPLTAEDRTRLNLAANQAGLVITAVGAPRDAAEKGLSPGDAILQVDRVAVSTAQRLDERRRPRARLRARCCCKGARGQSLRLSMWPQNKERRMRVLLVEDDADMAKSLQSSLTADDHTVEIANDGEAGEAMAIDGGYDVIVLDRMLPKKLGTAVVKALRDRGVSTPVLILSALHDEDHRVEGLNAGANDYLGKPFSTRELLARVRALWNGRDREPQTRLAVGDLEMDLLARTVKRSGKKLDLQPREFRLLEYLMRHSGRR